jgi:hypothetical protein
MLITLPEYSYTLCFLIPKADHVEMLLLDTGKSSCVRVPSRENASYWNVYFNGFKWETNIFTTL